MNRLGRGYSFEALRAKLLFTEGAHKRTMSRPKFQRRSETVVFGHMTTCDISIGTEDLEKNYGADISTLIQMIENGEL